jgi:hypothetical protein
MSDRDEFLEWVRTRLHDAELALHNGDARAAALDLVHRGTGHGARCVEKRHQLFGGEQALKRAVDLDGVRPP